MISPVPSAGPHSLTGGLTDEELLCDALVYSRLSEIEQHFNNLNFELNRHHQERIRNIKRSGLPKRDCYAAVSEVFLTYIKSLHENVLLCKSQQSNLLKAATLLKLPTAIQPKPQSRNKTWFSKVTSISSALAVNQAPFHIFLNSTTSLHKREDFLSLFRELLGSSSHPIGVKVKSLIENLNSAVVELHDFTMTTIFGQILATVSFIKHSVLSDCKSVDSICLKAFEVSFESIVIDEVVKICHLLLRKCVGKLDGARISKISNNVRYLREAFPQDFSQLGLPEDLYFIFENSSNFSNLFIAAQLALAEITDRDSITGKLSLINNVFDLLTKEVAARATGGCPALTTDHFISLLLLLLLYMDDCDCVIDLIIIPKLISDDSVKGRDGFTSATLELCLGFLENIKPSIEFMNFLDFGHFESCLEEYLLETYK
ncbi:hypothetical protein GEMRC1_003108 [Eukaryota sp. GEM-RC1]